MTETAARPLTDAARNLMLETLSSTMHDRQRHARNAEMAMRSAGSVDDPCTCDSNEDYDDDGCVCETRSAGDLLAEAAIEAQLAQAAATMAQAMATLLASNQL